MVVWHHRLKGLEFEQTLGGREGQESLVCCSLWGRKELVRLIDSDTSDQLNNKIEKDIC